MLSYLVAWVIYLTAVFALVAIYKAKFAQYLPEAVRPIIHILLLCVLLTPWPIDSETWMPAPAIIATLFHAMSGFWITALKSVFPILTVATIACFRAWWLNRQSTV